MDGYTAQEFVKIMLRPLKQGVKYALLAREMLIERGRFYPDGVRYLLNADGVVAPLRKQAQSLGEYPALGIFFFYDRRPPWLTFISYIIG